MNCSRCYSCHYFKKEINIAGIKYVFNKKECLHPLNWKWDKINNRVKFINSMSCVISSNRPVCAYFLKKS